MTRYRVRDRGRLRERMAESKREVPHSVRSLAQQVKSSPSTIGHLLTGERDSLDGELAQRISESLGSSLDELFVEENSPYGYGSEGGQP